MFDASAEAPFFGNAFETCSLQEALTKINAETSSTSQVSSALTTVEDWLEDPKNTPRAESDLEVYPTIIKVLVGFQHRQILALVGRPSMKKPTAFKIEGVTLMHRTVRAACRAPRRAGPGRLTRILPKLWSHIIAVLSSDAIIAKQVQALPYYCRIIKELADHSFLGYLSDVRGDAMQNLLRRLLQVQSVDAKTAAFDAITQLLRHADGCPSAAVPWLCEHLITVLRTHGHYAAGCFAVISLRCPMAFRDWLLSADHAEKFSVAMRGAWSSKTADSLSLVLRMALILKAPIPTTMADELVLLVLDTLDSSLARTEMVDIKEHHLRTVRLAELLALLVAHKEGSPQNAMKRLYSSDSCRLEQRCLPWALCAVRLCERFTSHLRDSNELLGLFKALCKIFSHENRLAAQEGTAVCRALTAAIAARAHAELFPTGMRSPNTPVHSSSLSGQGMTAAMLVAPEIVNIIPMIDITRGRNSWTDALSGLIRQLEAGMTHRGVAYIMQRGIAELAGMLFLVCPKSMVEPVARQFLSLVVGPQSTRSSQENAMIGCGILAAMRQHRPDAAMQRDLYKCLSGSTVDVRYAFLKLCTSDTNKDTDTSNFEEHESESFDHAFDDYLCALGSEVQSRRAVTTLKNLRLPQTAHLHNISQGRSVSAQVVAWQHRRDLSTARQFEASATVALLNAGPNAMISITSLATAGSISDDLLIHYVDLSVNFKTPPTVTQLGHADVIDTSVHSTRSLVGKPSYGVPACEAAVEDFASKAKNYLTAVQNMKEGLEEPPEAVISAATHLLPAMSAVLHVPVSSASSWPGDFRTCLLSILELARALIGGAAGQHVSVSMSEMLGDLLDVVENVGLPQTSEVGELNLKREYTFSSPGLADRCASLAEVCSNVITQRAVARSVKAPADIFSSRSSLMNSEKDEGNNNLRWSSLHLLIVLACCRLRENVNHSGEEALNKVLLCLRRVLLKTLEPADCMGALRLVVSELSLRYCSAALAELVAEFWCSVPDPASSSEVEDFLISALRLVGVASRQKETLVKVLHRLWSAAPMTGGGDPRLITFARKYRQDPESLRPRGKLLLAVLFTNCLPELQSLEGFGIAIDIVTGFCCDIVIDLILKDASLEVRSNVGIACTRSLFSLFDDTQVFPEFEASFQTLANASVAGGNPSQIPSVCIASLQVILQVALVDGYMQRIVPKLCTMGQVVGKFIGDALEALDHVFFGRSGTNGGSLLALLFRAQIFELYVRSGHRLTALALKEVKMALPPVPGRQDLGLHLPAAVAALAIVEDIEQIGDLATSCGFVSGSTDFQDLVFVPLAGTLLPLQKSLEPLRRMYGGERFLKIARDKGHCVVAFSLQLPFLTLNSQRPIDAEAIRIAYEELDPWQMGLDFKSFVCKHFRFLLAHLDRVLQASSAWAPGKVVDLWRGFASWVGGLSGSRLRLLLPALIRSGLMLPSKLRAELCVVIDSVVGNSSADALVRLASHQDESLRMILKAIETEWGHESSAESERGQISRATSQCPALCALLAVLRGLRPKHGVNEGARAAAQWMSLQMDSIFSRLVPEAQRCLSEGSEGLYEVGVGGGKRRRLGGSDGYSFVDALIRLEPPRPKLAWGPWSVPDLGLLRHTNLSVEADKSKPGNNNALARLLQLLSQPMLFSQLRDDEKLARAIAQGIAGMDLSDATLLDTELEGGSVEGAIYNAIRLGQLPKEIVPGKTSGVDEVLGCGALLGITVLQAHSSPQVRKLALEALLRMVAQRPTFDAAKKLLSTILDPQHLCLEDLEDIHVDALDSKASCRAHIRRASGSSHSLPEDPWAGVLACMQRRIPYSKWIRESCAQLLDIGSNDWSSPAKDILLSCLPLVQHVDWFAERMLGFAILKAAEQGTSGFKLAQTLSAFFKDAVQSREAHSIIHALHFVRLYQTKTRKRAVPHFPLDNGDSFWKNIDLCAAAACASRVGWARDGLLYLELHLARANPNLSISEALLQTGKNSTVDALFQTPGREVQLLHGLAQQLPEAELLYGVPNWCHATSRLARAQLGQDHLGTLHLHSHLREAAMITGGDAQHDFSVGDALARTGLHTVLADTALPERACSATWERRMEALWRLRQWGTTSSADGFNVRLHSVFSSLALPPERSITELAASAIEGPLVGLVSQITSTLHVGSPEQVRHGAVQLQMVGSIFDVVDAVSHKSNPNMQTLVSRWSCLDAMPSAQQFSLLEPLHSAQATLLSLAASSNLELRFLTALAGRARGAAEPHRAMGILEQAQRVAAGAPRMEVLRLRWEQARCFWELREQQQAINIARAVAGECRGSPSTNAEDRGWKARVLSDTGVWLSISRLEGTEVIRNDYFEPAVGMMEPGDAQPRRQLADFLDAQLSEEKDRIASFEHAMSRRFLLVNEASLKDHQEQIKKIESQRATATSANDLRILKERVKVLEKQCEDDRTRERNGRDRLKVLALSCVQQFGQCLKQDNGGNLTKVACRFLSLWFDYHQENDEITTCVRDVMQNLALGPLALFIYQLASRLGVQEDKDKLFQKTLEELLVRICSRSAPALWPLIALRNGGKVPQGMRGAERFVADEVKINAAHRVLERLGKQPNLRTTLQAVEAVSKFYLAVAFLNVDKSKRNQAFKLSQIPEYKEAEDLLKHLPVPTTAAPLEGVSSVPRMHRFNDTMSLAKQGISAPRFITLFDSAGNEHVQIVKGMDDLRQDAVMQQLFRLLNDLFSESPRARQSDLRLRTFQVVPLSPCAGIMECVQKAATLGEILTGNTSPNEGAHHRYRPQDWEHGDCRKKMQTTRESLQPGQNDAGVLEKALATCREHFQPVMNLVFLEYFPSPRDWHRARQHFARSVAVSSMVGYIVGLGDRHPNNILLDQTTGEVVHIDFGIAFDQGRALRVPELVPFRLTSDMQDGLGCLGTCGLFRRCSETTMEVLRDGAAFVTAIVDVFVHDPVYMWSLSPRKALQNKDLPSFDAAVGIDVLPNVGDGNEMAKRALLAVKGKLHGTHGMSASLAVPAHVGWVIREAVDPSNLAKMYFGWSPWL